MYRFTIIKADERNKGGESIQPHLESVKNRNIRCYDF